jgi:hypothetical protein
MLEGIKQEIEILRGKINSTMNDLARNIMYRERYVSECNRWLVVNDAFRQFMINARERSEKHLQYLNGTEKCEKCKCRDEKK